MTITGPMHAQPSATTRRVAAALAAGVVLFTSLSAAAAPTPSPPSGSASSAAADDATPKIDEAGMWIGTSAVICLAQDGRLAATPFGRQLTESPGYAAWHKAQRPAVLQCFAGAHLLSPALCNDIFAQDPQQASEDRNRALFDKHAATIAHLANMDDCVSR